MGGVFAMGAGAVVGADDELDLVRLSVGGGVTFISFGFNGPNECVRSPSQDLGSLFRLAFFEGNLVISF